MRNFTSLRVPTNVCVGVESTRVAKMEADAKHHHFLVRFVYLENALGRKLKVFGDGVQCYPKPKGNGRRKRGTK